MKVRYRDGYRFQLEAPAMIKTTIKQAAPGNLYVGLDAAGVMTFAAGYAWDGASGPIPQTPNVIRPSLAHDGLYQLIREGHLGPEMRLPADQLFRDLLREDGTSWLVAQVAYLAVRAFGGQFASPEAIKPVLEAP
jgi:hypothetical protein